jgi:hypothetical protein
MPGLWSSHRPDAPYRLEWPPGGLGIRRPTVSPWDVAHGLNAPPRAGRRRRILHEESSNNVGGGISGIVQISADGRSRGIGLVAKEPCQVLG